MHDRRMELNSPALRREVNLPGPSAGRSCSKAGLALAVIVSLVSLDVVILAGRALREAPAVRAGHDHSPEALRLELAELRRYVERTASDDSIAGAPHDTSIRQTIRCGLGPRLQANVESAGAASILP